MALEWLSSGWNAFKNWTANPENQKLMGRMGSNFAQGQNFGQAMGDPVAEGIDEKQDRAHELALARLKMLKTPTEQKLDTLRLGEFQSRLDDRTTDLADLRIMKDIYTDKSSLGGLEYEVPYSMEDKTQALSPGRYLELQKYQQAQEDRGLTTEGKRLDNLNKRKDFNKIETPSQFGAYYDAQIAKGVQPSDIVKNFKALGQEAQQKNKTEFQIYYDAQIAKGVQPSDIVKNFKALGKGKPSDDQKIPTPAIALKRTSDIRKSMATLEKSDIVTAFLAQSNPELAKMIGQKIEPELKAQLMSAWEDELNYYSPYTGVKREKQKTKQAWKDYQ